LKTYLIYKWQKKFTHKVISLIVLKRPKKYELIVIMTMFAESTYKIQKIGG